MQNNGWAPVILETRGLTKSFGGLRAVNQCSLQVRRGNIAGLIGPSGAGKTTLLKTVFGLLRARRGRVVFTGRDITGMPPHEVVRLGLSYVPQAENTFLGPTVEENLEMGAYLRRNGVQARVEELLELFPDLRRFRSTRIHTLSGGQRQMVTIARGLMLGPMMLLVDEPSAGLSPLIVDVIFNDAGETRIDSNPKADGKLQPPHSGSDKGMGAVAVGNRGSM